MRFSRGVYAQVTFKDGSRSGYFADSRSVYDRLIDDFDHYTAAEAEGWTEMACVGEIYEEYEFEIEIVEAQDGKENY